MQIINSTHIAILKVLYAKWPLGVSGDEIVKYVQNKYNSAFNMEELLDHITHFKSIGQIKELIHPEGTTIGNNLFYLTPNMFIAISEHSKNPNSNFS